MMRDNTVTQLERNTCNGMLLFGRPGTGKSILTYAMATKFGFKLYEVGMANVNGKWQGNSEKYVMATQMIRVWILKLQICEGPL